MGQLHSIRYRRDTAANWASVNPVLQEGEPGYETDTGIVKIGDGVTAYNSLGAIFHSEIEALENDINYATTIKQKAVTEEGGVFNGDFEYGTGSRTTGGWIGDEKYGWYIYGTSSYLAEFDVNNTHRGSKSLKLATTGTGAYIEARSQATEYYEVGGTHLKPSTRCRLSCWMKTEYVSGDSDSGALVNFLVSKIDGSIDAEINVVPAVKTTTDWTYYETIVTLSADAQFGHFEPRIYGHNGTGTLIMNAWFDDIKLEQIDTQTVNTQVATPASVSVTGVTTTDNVDQSLETSGQTYTLTTGIDEGATHRQTFTPAADRGDGKHLLTKIQALVAAVGTGDWTLTVHDSSNNVLASQTISNGSMDTGDVDFDVPAILDVGTEYHFHITSTVADGTVTTTTLDDLETVDYHAHFAKHTESPVIEANGAKLDLTGVKLLTGATITVNKDGTGKSKYIPELNLNDSWRVIDDVYDMSYGTYSTGRVANGWQSNVNGGMASGSVTAPAVTHKISFGYPISHLSVRNWTVFDGGNRGVKLQASHDNSTWVDLVAAEHTGEYKSLDIETDAMNGYTDVYIRSYSASTTEIIILDGMIIEAVLDCSNVQLPLMVPSAEEQTETADLTQNPIDISEGQFWQLSNDLTGWGSRTITMLASEALFESQTAAASTIYVYDSNGTGAWTWDDRNGLVPPADRTSGVVMAKFLVGDNQIKTSVNDGSMKANFNLAWDEESLRAAINRLTDLVNMQYPIVVEVEDVPAIDVENEPTGASAETGYTNDVTSLRQTAAGVAAIAYTGLTPREDRFSEWLDIIVTCNDGDGTLQGKLYTEGGTLIATYADLEANPVLSISDPDYKYSRERLVLQISASSETTSTAWTVSKITWRYQYNG